MYQNIQEYFRPDQSSQNPTFKDGPVQKLQQPPEKGRLNLPLKEALLLKQPEPRSELTIFCHNSILFICGLCTSGK